MPLHIGKVDAEVDVMRAVDTAGAAAENSANPATAVSGGGPVGGMDIESLRALVLQILREELASFQRQQG